MRTILGRIIVCACVYGSSLMTNLAFEFFQYIFYVYMRTILGRIVVCVCVCVCVWKYSNDEF